MADVPMIYLGGAHSDAWSQDSEVLFQPDSRATVLRLPLGEALQACAGQETRMVISVADACLTHVSLSRKQAKHLQRVLPYLLEEQLLDSPDALWFVSRKVEGDNYQVSAIPRVLIEQLRSWAEQAGARLMSIQVDADCLAALAPLLAPVAEQQWLLLADREQALIADNEQYQSVFALFGDALQGATELDDLDSLFGALRRGSGIELMAGAYAASKPRQAALQGPWRPLVLLAAAVFFIALVCLWLQQWRYQSAADEALATAKQRYEQLFPGDKATSALNRQFQGRLARLGGASTGGSDFFPLLVPIAQVLKEVKVEPKRLQYDQRQNTLLLDVGAKDYAQLEALQAAIRDQGAKASIANYRNGAQGVSARIKVEQPG